MKILVIDNYDSFTFNLVHLIEELCDHEVIVKRNDEIDIEYVDQFEKIVLSPGPGIPSEAGNMMKIIKALAPTKSILGICLGHQGIAETFGGCLENMSTVLHGISTPMKIEKEDPIFNGVTEGFMAGRYHSWCVSNENFPNCLEVLCLDENNQIMAIKHKEYAVYGVQFHPESVLTPEGEKIVGNWIKM